MPVYWVLPGRLRVLSLQAERPLTPSIPLLIRGFGSLATHLRKRYLLILFVAQVARATKQRTTRLRVERSITQSDRHA